MLAAIQLDDQALFHADEVGDVGADRILALELVAGEPSPPNRRPELALRIGRLVTHPAGIGEEPFRSDTTICCIRRDH